MVQSPLSGVDCAPPSPLPFTPPLVCSADLAPVVVFPRPKKEKKVDADERAACAAAGATLVFLFCFSAKAAVVTVSLLSGSIGIVRLLRPTAML